MDTFRYEAMAWDAPCCAVCGAEIDPDGPRGVLSFIHPINGEPLDMTVCWNSDCLRKAPAAHNSIRHTYDFSRGTFGTHVWRKPNLASGLDPSV